MTITKTLPDAVGGEGWLVRLAVVDGEGGALAEPTGCLLALLPAHPAAVARSRVAIAQYLARPTPGTISQGVLGGLRQRAGPQKMTPDPGERVRRTRLCWRLSRRLRGGLRWRGGGGRGGASRRGRRGKSSRWGGENWGRQV